jgi:hypothetical protein
MGEGSKYTYIFVLSTIYALIHEYESEIIKHDYEKAFCFQVRKSSHRQHNHLNGI